jgi:ParB/RepB/Spo0J family partition protein
MEIELQQLELRYERLRLVRPARERRLLASLAESGQQAPIVVVSDAAPERFVVIDGYKRIRCLRRLTQDTVHALRLELEEAEALMVSRLMGAAEAETALEQAWLLDELATRFGLSQDVLARRFERSVSWVSRRLALVRELPDAVQDRVRRGEIVPHAAVKYLVPLARAKKSDCEGLVAAIGATRVSSRDMGRLYAGWRDGTAKTRERLIASPLVYLKAVKEAEAEPAVEPGPGQKLLNDFDILGAVARRANKQLREGVLRRLLPGEHEEIERCFGQSRADIERLTRQMDMEGRDAGREPTNRHPGATPPGACAAGDFPDDESRAEDRAQSDPSRLGEGAALGAHREGGLAPGPDSGSP